MLFQYQLHVAIRVLFVHVQFQWGTVTDIRTVARLLLLV